MNIGVVQKKILVLLLTGLALGLSRSPRQSSYIIRAARRDWKNIDKKQFKRSITSLRDHGAVKMRKNNDGTMRVLLTKKGKRIAERHSLDFLKIKKPRRWDKKWRMVIFDVPEKNRAARDIFRFYIKRLGFYELQHSVWVYPYKCAREVQYLVDFFGMARYVHLVEAAMISNDRFFRRRFKL